MAVALPPVSGFVAVNIAFPAETPFIMPLLSTVIIFLLELVHTILLLSQVDLTLMPLVLPIARSLEDNESLIETSSISRYSAKQ